MNRLEIINELKKFFHLRELVCPHTYEAFGERAWQFFDKDFLMMLLILRRDIIKKPMIINNWHNGGHFTQRGFRCNICQLVKDKTIVNKIYLTSHANGAAIDFDVVGMTIEQVHGLVKEKCHLLPCNVRMESCVTWNHIDIYDNGIPYSEFSA